MGAWLGIGLIGGLISVAVVWSYLHALGADRDVEHARAMAMTTLLLASAAITTGLTKLRQPATRWLVFGTLASLGVFVQVPVLSRLLNLRPLHGTDWALVAAAFALMALATHGLAMRLRQHLD
jgi:Ca2+-transporting ATPase